MVHRFSTGLTPHPTLQMSPKHHCGAKKKGMHISNSIGPRTGWHTTISPIII
uniref:Uncharacterized protein n=1 Tax=Arundo donax TaxID=35708 RepID=A0A0A9F994_ARUDO